MREIQRIKAFKMDQSEKEKIKEKFISYLIDRMEIIFAYLYGSFVDQELFRDIDLALYLNGIEKERAMDYLLEVSLDIEKIAGIPVDVKTLNNAPADYQYNVVSGKMLFSKNEELRSCFVERVVNKYLDMAPRVRRAP